jgi:Zn finger protein HypA/HybF involved in hydrogenase expression
MWIVSFVKPTGADPALDIMAERITAEAEACPRCKQVFYLTGFLPLHCPACGAERDQRWANEHELAALRLLIERGQHVR